ncbi:uncharacterized protein L201_001360 [Kwoniella dendrophila CBS 6074]|uniref:Uncharacterized protein n=1 Tax=Kwoniella dendrophila CBS 6074 TaxID=1295534 RepID=A0AAX4JNN9_9TREE
MPSLFSKFRHKKSASQSSNSSINEQSNQPPSPARASQDYSASSRSRLSLDQSQQSPVPPLPQSQAHPQQSSPNSRNVDRIPNQNVISPNSNSEFKTQPLSPRRLPDTHRNEDVVVIGKTGSGVDSKGHSKPFVDESERPELPTTTSNVNNPIPVPSSSTRGAKTSYLPQDEVEQSNKPLPAVPEIQSSVKRDELDSFPVPPKSPQRQSISSPSHQSQLPTSIVGNIQHHQHHHEDRVRSPPLPHVDSINRQQLHQSEQERPDLIASSSRPVKSSEKDLIGKQTYPHVSSTSTSTSSPSKSTGLPHSEKEEDLNQLLNQSQQGQGQSQSRKDSQVEIPSRASSLYHSSSSQTRTPIAREEIPQIPQLDFQEHRSKGEWNLNSSALDPISNHPDGILNERFNNLSLTKFAKEQGGLSLDEQRNLMINAISKETETRFSKIEPLTKQGIQVFKNAGMERVLGTENSIDIRSKELEPVVQEIIYPLEHTEYTTILTRCIHKTHYLPLIQPIHDPNPIILATRHRIYDNTTKQWHEVIGDSAALAILGEDVFRNGEKTYRELRKPALPGLEPMDEDAIRMAKEAGLTNSGDGLSTFSTVKQYEYSTNQQSTIPIIGEHEDVSIDGIGQGQGKGRVLEREYLLKDAKEDENEKGEWKEIASYVGIGKGIGSSLKNDNNNNNNGDNVGVAL